MKDLNLKLGNGGISLAGIATIYSMYRYGRLPRNTTYRGNTEKEVSPIGKSSASLCYHVSY